MKKIILSIILSVAVAFPAMAYDNSHSRTGAQVDQAIENGTAVGTTTGIVKSNGANGISAATDGTDYWSPASDGSGSGLDADTLDGHDSAYFPAKSGDTYTGTHDFSGASEVIPSGATLPGTCSAGEMFYYTGGTSGKRFYICESANSWVLQGDGGGGSTPEDTAYGSSWNGNTNASSKNAIYDYLHQFDDNDNGRVDIAGIDATGTPSSSTYLRGDGTWGTPSGSGDVTAASNFGTDNVLIRSDGTAKGVQSSGISVDDSNNMSGIGTISSGAITSSGLVKGTGFETTGADGTHRINAANTNDYSTTTEGDTWFNSTSHLWKYYANSATRWLVSDGSFSGNTETLITVTPQTDGTVDFVVDSDLHNFSWTNVVWSDLPSLTSSYVIVGNSSNVPAAVQMTGDVAISPSGVTTIQANSVALTTDTTGNYVASVATTAPLTGGATGSEGATLTLSMPAATSSQNGYLTSTDWSTFNGKISASSTDTLTNKTFDANGTGNSLSNVDDGNMTTAAASKLNRYHQTANFDPDNQYANYSGVVVLDPYTAAAMTVSGIRVYLNEDPTTELSFTFYQKTAAVGYTGGTTIGTGTTTNGVLTITSGWTDNTIPAGSKVWVVVGTDPDATTTGCEVAFDATYD